MLETLYFKCFLTKKFDWPNFGLGGTLTKKSKKLFIVDTLKFESSCRVDTIYVSFKKVLAC
jgi:hypothetical protein